MSPNTVLLPSKLVWLSRLAQLLMLALIVAGAGSENEYVDSGEYVQDDQEPFQAEDITRKMI